MQNIDSKTLAEGIRVLQIEAAAITHLIKNMDHRFLEVVELCYRCRGRVVLIGMGKSGLIAKKISATLASTGTPAFFMHPSEAIHGDLGMISKEDIALMISNSGETEEVLRMLPSLKRLDLRLITLTGDIESSLAEESDVVLDVSVREEACPLGLAPTASTTAALAMGDAIAVALLQKRGFKKEDFASFHPGGSLGKNLLLKVKDVMHSGKDVPRVSANTPMKEVVLEMTEKKLGMTTVFSKAEELVGVITDGDLRRLIRVVHPEGRDIFETPACDVMNHSPKSVASEALAAEAVHIMETHSVTSLLALDSSGKVEGVVHLHDLLKEGVA